METTDTQLNEIVQEAITCARQTDKWRKPYAAVIQPDGTRSFLSSKGRFRTLLEADDEREKTECLETITSLPVGAVVETRNARHCSHKYELRTCWTRTEDGWQKEEITGSNKHGY